MSQSESRERKYRSLVLLSADTWELKVPKREERRCITVVKRVTETPGGAFSSIVPLCSLHFYIHHLSQ